MYAKQSKTKSNIIRICLEMKKIQMDISAYHYFNHTSISSVPDAWQDKKQKKKQVIDSAKLVYTKLINILNTQLSLLYSWLEFVLTFTTNCLK